MSFFRKIAQIAAPIVGGVFGGPAGAALGLQVSGALAKQPAPMALSGPTLVSTQSGSAVFTQAMGALPQLGRALPMIGAAGGLVVSGARAAMRSAQVYCRRHPAWCAQIGGTAAIMAMIESGQLPPVPRRRGRGITPKDLKSFRRVANLVRGYCPTVRRIPSRSLHVRKTGISHA